MLIIFLTSSNRSTRDKVSDNSETQELQKAYELTATYKAKLLLTIRGGFITGLNFDSKKIT